MQLAPTIGVKTCKMQHKIAVEGSALHCVRVVKPQGNNSVTIHRGAKHRYSGSQRRGSGHYSCTVVEPL